MGCYIRICFTWVNNIGSKRSKLVRFLISKDMLDELPNISSIIPDSKWYNHFLIVLKNLQFDYEPNSF